MMEVDGQETHPIPIYRKIVATLDQLIVDASESGDLLLVAHLQTARDRAAGMIETLKT